MIDRAAELVHCEDVEHEAMQDGQHAVVYEVEMDGRAEREQKETLAWLNVFVCVSPKPGPTLTDVIKPG